MSEISKLQKEWEAMIDFRIDIANKMEATISGMNMRTEIIIQDSQSILLKSQAKRKMNK